MEKEKLVLKDGQRVRRNNVNLVGIVKAGDVGVVRYGDDRPCRHFVVFWPERKMTSVVTVGEFEPLGVGEG